MSKPCEKFCWKVLVSNIKAAVSQILTIYYVDILFNLLRVQLHVFWLVKLCGSNILAN